MPKFSFEYEIGLNEVLDSLGMGIAFGHGDVPTDFSGINPAAELVITSVKHKTFVQVDEEGTEAAAATEVVIAFTSDLPREFIVDRPFLFAIRERLSGTVLFLGRIVDPTQ